MINETAYTDDCFRELCDLLAANARVRLPEPPLLLPGDLAWRLPASDPGENLTLFRRGSLLSGFVWFEPLTGFDYDVRAGEEEDAELVQKIFSRARSRREALAPGYPRFIDLTDMAAWRAEVESPRVLAEDRHRYLTTIALASDARRINDIEAHGYVSTKHYSPVYLWDLTEELPAPSPPEGTRLRSVSGADLDMRVAVHRAAWAGSSFDVDRYQEIRARPNYDENLDIVLEAGDTFGSYCLCWADPTSGIGLFEPVGTIESWRGRGAAGAVILEGLARLKQSGMQVARVSTAGFNAPARQLYESCGFTQVDEERTFLRRIN